MRARLQTLLARVADADLREVVRGGAVALAVRVGGTAFNFAFLWLVARTLGAEGTGLYALASSVVVLATVLGVLGLDQALVRFVAEAAERGRPGLVRGYVRQGATYALAASLGVTLVGWVLAPVLAARVFRDPELGTPLRYMLLAVPFVVAAQVRSGGLQGLRRIRDAQLVSVFALGAGTCLAFLALVGLAQATGGAVQVTQAAGAYTFGAAAACALGVGLWRRHAPRPPAPFEPAQPSEPAVGRSLLQTSLPMLWVASMLLVNTWSAVFLLGLYADAADVGLYNVALRLAMLTSFVLAAVNSIAAPKFAAFNARGDYAAMERVAVRSAQLTTAVAAPLLLLLILAAPWCMGVFGAEFVAGAGVLVVLAVGQFVNVAAGSVGQVLAMTGHERDLRTVIVVSAALNVAGCLVLIPRFGALGAAAATAAAWGVMNGLCVWYARRRLGIGTHAGVRLGGAR